MGIVKDMNHGPIGVAADCQQHLAPWTLAMANKITAPWRWPMTYQLYGPGMVENRERDDAQFGIIMDYIFQWDNH
jgi:hypothetical protein